MSDKINDGHLNLISQDYFRASLLLSYQLEFFSLTFVTDAEAKFVYEAVSYP